MTDKTSPVTFTGCNLLTKTAYLGYRGGPIPVPSNPQCAGPYFIRGRAGDGNGQGSGPQHG